MSESILQSQCFQWHWNTFPQCRRLLHANYNNSENRIKGSINKAIGVVAGVADLEYFYDRKAYFIELKTEDGHQSKDQKEFQSRIEEQGGAYVVIRSFEEFQSLISKIHGNTLSPSPSLAASH